MSTDSKALSGAPMDSQAKATRAAMGTRPFYWSVRREIWEHRSIYIAPLAVAGGVLLATVISFRYLPDNVREASALGGLKQQVALAMPYNHSSFLLSVTAFLVGMFYCVDALYGERRDRSILFWKSLPVSDLMTVLAKASIPLMVLPLVVFVINFALQLILLIVASVVLTASGVGVAALWGHLPLLQMEVGLLYGLAVIALWHAPLYAWMLLISVWARKATFVWLVFPPIVIVIFEATAFHTWHFARFLGVRLYGFSANAFNYRLPDGTMVDPHYVPLSQFTPGKFLGTPGLWVGLAFAAAFLAATVQMRRKREPI